MQIETAVRFQLTLTVLHVLTLQCVTGVPVVGGSEGTLQRMSDINKKAQKQKILLPRMNSRVQLYNYLARGFLSASSMRHGNPAKPIGTNNSDSHSSTYLWRARSTDGRHKLVTFITNDGVNSYRGNSPLHPDGILDRLVRIGNRLVTKETDIGEAAHFLVKRFPPVCNGTGDVSSVKPQYVQLMLIDIGSEYHQSLLQFEYGHKNRLIAKFVKPDGSDCPPPGYDAVSPSVHPGTLFTMLYGPWIE